MSSTLFIGIDLHKCSFTAYGTDPDGNVLCRETMPTKCRGKIERFFRGLAEQYDRVSVAVESVGFYQWFWDLVEPLVHDIHLADASQVRAAAGRKAKTDANDAATLARLLRMDALPTAFVPDPELREFRALVRHRARLQRRAASIKHSIRCEMNKLNLPGPDLLDTGTLHKWLAAQYAKLDTAARLALEDLAEELALFEKQVRALDDRLARVVAETPRFREPIERLRSIPGVGLLTAAVIYAESGGLDRFEHEGEIASYAGLTPRVFQSAEICRHGRISKAGPPILRKCLVNAAWTAVRTSPGIKKRFEGIARRAGKKRAIVAMARKILVWAWAMQKRGTVFDPARVAA
jgi:transposase